MRQLLPALTAVAAAAALAACNPNADTDNPAIATEEPGTATVAAPAEGATSFTEDQARGRLEEAGYTNVTGLTLGPDGIWRGTAVQQGQTTTVAVDYQGNIVTGAEATATTMSGQVGQTGAATTTTPAQ